MMRCVPLPSSGAQIQISSLFSFVSVSQSAGEGPARAPKPPLNPSLCVFFPPSSSFSLAVFLLFYSSSSPLLIALLISHWQVRMRQRKGGEKKEHKLFKSHWPTLPDISLGIHISKKILKKKCFSFFPPTGSSGFLKNSLLSLSAGGHFPRILNLIPHQG